VSETVAGAAFAFATVILWGVLPVALKLLVVHLDPLTLTAVRFATAAVLLGALMRAWRTPGIYRGMLRARPLLYGIALLGLFGNFLMFAAAVQTISPTAATLVSQCGPLFLIFGGALVLREPLGRAQVVGAIAVMIGMVLFFHISWDGSLHGSAGLGIGHLFMLVGAVSWAAYALTQRRLAASDPPRQSLLLLYAGSALVLLPFSRPSALLTLQGPALLALAFAAVNTVLAYGALGEALRRLDAARVGAILSLAPILTAVAERLIASSVDLKPDRLDVLAIIGGLVVVLGSAACAIGAKPKPTERP
jgi:drug/metabolite transporter (DMT)-like permease